MTRYRLVACSDGPLSEGDIKIAVAACAFLYSAAKHGIYSPSAFDEDRGRAAEALQTGLEAALKGAGDAWQPIESAPKDGTRVLLGVVLTNPQQVGQEVEFYHLAKFCGDYWSPYIPNKWTHWQPLPAPPSAKGEV